MQPLKFTACLFALKNSFDCCFGVFNGFMQLVPNQISLVYCFGPHTLDREENHLTRLLSQVCQAAVLHAVYASLSCRHGIICSVVCVGRPCEASCSVSAELPSPLRF